MPAPRLGVRAGWPWRARKTRPGFTTRKAAWVALLGEQGETRTINRVEGHRRRRVGGFPSAGKFTLVAQSPALGPKIADYPSRPDTQPRCRGRRRPQLHGRGRAGLIEGASEGDGVADSILRHSERCAAIVHVIDCAHYLPGRDPLTDLDVIEVSMKAHGGLEDRPRLVRPEQDRHP